MNPADVAQAVPVAHELSFFGLFWQAHFIVKLVMLGLLAASVWCWAIIIDKTLLYSRSKRAMDRFEDVFWSGQSLEELYRSLQSRPATAWPRCSLPPCANGNGPSRVRGVRSRACRSASTRCSTSPSSARWSGSIPA